MMIRIEQAMMHENSTDVVVIGAGINGLVTASYLAKSGIKVAVVEKREVLGGAAATEDVFPGFRVNTGSADVGLFHPRIVSDLHLQNHGLQYIDNSVQVFLPQLDGNHLTLFRNREKSQLEIARFSAQDARKYRLFLETMRSMADVIEMLMLTTPPELPKLHCNQLLPWIRAGIKVKRLGNEKMMEFLRILPMSVSDFLAEWFETPQLNAAIGFNGVAGLMQGPRAAGTTFMLLYQAMMAGKDVFKATRFCRGGSGALSDVLANAARMYGAIISTGNAVDKIIVENGRVRSVLLNDRKRINTRVIVSSVNPHHTFLELVDPTILDVGFVRELRQIKYRGSTSKVNFALKGLPKFPGSMRENLDGHIVICPNIEILERAYDAAKYGRIPQTLVLDATIPSIIDNTLAPKGKHVMSIDVRYTPYHLESSDWEAMREHLGDQVVELLELYSPGFKDLIIDRQILTPIEYERQYALREGCIHHGQMGLDQILFMRPIPEYARYRTPIHNLYLCGAGTHPGGGVTGLPGYNAAREIIYDFRRSKEE
jgi:phytoene dehydrogenase-like protein